MPLYDFTGENLKGQQILSHIIEIISNNTELGNERILLACHAFHNLLPTQCDSHYYKDIVIGCQKLTLCNFYIFEKQYPVSDLELFKLLNAYGYLQMNRKDVNGIIGFEYDVLLATFDVIYRNSMKYTRYSYFAYKVLSMWLKRLKNTPTVRFWIENNCILEQKLEAIIFSNWSNALNLSKQNAEIFNTYLQIMLQKYNRAFIEYIYLICYKNMSWQNETKYIILAAIFQIQDMKVQVLNSSFLFNLCFSLTKNSLRCGGTKLYLIILRRLSEAVWKKMFGKIMKFVIVRWESGEQ